MEEKDRCAGNVLIVDDMPDNLVYLAGILAERGLQSRLASSGKIALESALLAPPDIILLDIGMPEMDGFEVCDRLKAAPALASVPVLFLTAKNDPQAVVEAFARGAADFVSKPFHREELIARVEAHIKIKRLQEELAARNRCLESLVSAKAAEIQESQMATIKVLASQAEFRDNETGRHIRRVQEFCRVLASSLANSGAAPEADRDFVDTIYYSSILHDIGKVGIPDTILLKPGPLDEAEAAIMRRHTLIGAENMEEARRSYPNNAFINMGIEIALCHHERWDGGGYPRGISGRDIPLSARIMNLADQYDALRSSRPYKAEMDHRGVLDVIMKGDGRTEPSHFDPMVLEAFARSHEEMADIYDSLADPA
jgi:putative two-component system response regulator